MEVKEKKEIIEKIIKICSTSLATDELSQLKCECGKSIGGGVDLFCPVGKSDTYWIRNTLQSMLDYDLIQRKESDVQNSNNSNHL